MPGLTCTGELPCPAEMGGSIHIHGTGSSIVDTVFVCRDLTEHQQAIPFKRLEALIRGELSQLEAAGMRPTHGDIRCITYGHLTRLAILTLYPEWDDEARHAREAVAVRPRARRARAITCSSSHALPAAPAAPPAKIKKPQQPEVVPYAAAV